MRLLLPVILSLFLGASVSGQQTPITVTLNVVPGEVWSPDTYYPGATWAGTPIKLSASVPSTSKRSGRQPVVPQSMLYTFTAERTWPCRQSFVVRSKGEETSWIPPKAGRYDISVTTTNPETGAKGTATKKNLNVFPRTTFGHPVTFSYDPPSGSATNFPFTLKMNISIGNPPQEPVKWFLSIFNSLPTGTGCVKEVTTNMATCEFTIGMDQYYEFSGSISKVRVSDCEFVGHFVKIKGHASLIGLTSYDP